MPWFNRLASSQPANSIFRPGLPTAHYRTGYQTAHFGRLTNNYGHEHRHTDPEAPTRGDTGLTDSGTLGVARSNRHYLDVN